MQRVKRQRWGAQLKALALGIFTAFLSVTCAEFSFPPSEARIDENGHLILPKGPYQVAGESGEILVGVQLPETELEGVEDGELTYWRDGEEEEAFTIELQPAWDRLYFARLTDLEPGSDYRMQITTSEHETVIHPVRRPTATQTEFSFLVVGDTKPYPTDVAGPLVQQMSNLPAAFYVHLGDFAREGDHVGDWSNFLEYHRPLLNKMPILPVVGNHDRSKYLVFSNIFLIPQKEGEIRRYYQFEYGNTLVIVLDAFTDYFSGSAQYDFLRDALERGRDDDIDHIFIASHKPFYSSGSHGGSKDLKANLLPLIENYPVTAVLGAHDHCYQRSKPINGIVHFIIGGGGAELKKVGYDWFTARAVKANHFAQFIIEGPSVSVRAFDVDGTVIDEARLK